MPTIIGCLLPDPYYSTVESIREQLVVEFGVEEYVNPVPHYTLFPLEGDVDVGAVESALEEAIENHSPVSVHTDGVGAFPGNAVWLPVAKSPELTALHAEVVSAVEHLGEPPVPYYRPHRWFPHVGFALGLDDALAVDVVEFLLDYDLEWDCIASEVTITRPPAEGTRYEQVASFYL